MRCGNGGLRVCGKEGVDGQVTLVVRGVGVVGDDVGDAASGGCRGYDGYGTQSPCGDSVHV